MPADKNIKILKNWQNAHWNKVKTIISRYFLYDNLKKNFPDFCPLFRKGEICHKDVPRKKFCCFFCACPHFITKKEKNNYGFCKFPRNFGKRLKNGFWDCSDCSFSHDIKYAKKNIDTLNKI